MICSYCKTETQNHETCDFCQADLSKKRPKINELLIPDISMNWEQPRLETLHTYDLLLVLRHIRAERTTYYRIMQAVRKAPQEAKNDNYEENNEYGQQLYRELTARKNIIEQILVDRMGYFPKRIDDKLLNALYRKIEGNVNT